MRYAAGVTLAVLFAVGLSCSDDPVIPPKQAPPQYQNLSQKWHVLGNLEVAWNEFSANRYEELLDENFVFYFAASDIGGSIPAEWDRATEVNAVGRMFERNPADPNRVLSIDMDLKFNKDTMTWVESMQVNPPYAGETWYTATVPYSFTIKTINDNTYITGGGEQAAYTVRPVDVGGKTVWRLVEFRDLGSN